MKRIVAIVLAFAIGWFAASCVFGAEPKTNSGLQAMPAPADADYSGDVVFGGKRGDKGLKPIDPPKLFDIDKPNVFAGFRILLWGITIAGVLFGLFLAAVIVVFTLRFIRRTAAPAVTGVPDASFAALQLFDNVRLRIENRKKELEAEQAEIEKRMGKAKRSSTTKKE